MSVVTITLKKDSEESKVGLRLTDDKKRKSVKVMDVDPGGPLAGVVSKGDTIVSIDGVACNQGHEAAANILRTTQGSIELIVKPPAASSGPMRFFRKSSSKGSRSSRASADDTSSERSVPVSGEGGGEEEATHPTDMEMNAATALQSWARGRSIRKSLEDEAVDESESASATGQVGDAATATGSEDEPTVAVTPGSPREPGEYVVKLRRNNSPSIGMRLVQKRYDDQPCIADIDPTGPAAGHDIASGDILLEVNWGA